MKAPDCAYIKPGSLGEAVACLARYGDSASILAGGQSLMASLNFRLADPEFLIDINGLADTAPELAAIADRGDHIRIGLLVRHAEIVRSPLIAECLPMVSMAAGQVAHPAIRNRGTVCGSLAYGDPAAEWPALAVALDAQIGLVSERGERRVAANGFFTGLFESGRAGDEIIHYLGIPKKPAGVRHGFYELARRHGDFALAGVCVSASGQETLDDPQIVFLGVHSHAQPASHLEALLNGRMLAEVDRDALSAALDKDLQPFDDIHATASQRLHLAGVVLRRAVAAMMNEGNTSNESMAT